MKLRRVLLVAVALFVIALGAVSFALPRLAGGVEPTAAACARCGDGVCARSCENQYTCPQDCGGTVGRADAPEVSGRAR